MKKMRFLHAQDKVLLSHIFVYKYTGMTAISGGKVH